MKVVDLNQKRVQKILDEARTANENLVHIFSNQDALTKTPLRILRLTSETRKRLSDSLSYQVLVRAAEIQTRLIREDLDDDPDASLFDLCYEDYPILGNALQVVFEYLNERIEQSELRVFYDSLAEDFDQFHALVRDEWRMDFDSAFFIPSSCPPDDVLVMGLLSDPYIVLEKYEYLICLLDKYRDPDPAEAPAEPL